MKEATGELNMTVVTLVAISAIAALLWFVVWPMIQRMIVENTCQTYGSTWFAVQNTTAGTGTDLNGDADVSAWYCCEGTKGANGQITRPTQYNASSCFAAE